MLGNTRADGSSCGAWLIAGIVEYLLGIEMNSNTLTRLGYLTINDHN